MVDYWRERLPLNVFGPIAVVLALPAHLAVPFVPVRFGADVGFAILLLAQFRLWDDLADRGVDAVQHPERVLVRARSSAKSVAVCVALGAINCSIAVQRDRPEFAVCILAGLIALLLFAYSGSSKEAVKDLLRLLKYPAFVMLLAVGQAAASVHTATGAALVAYAAACAYEVVHDPASSLRTLLYQPVYAAVVRVICGDPRRSSQ